MYSSSLLVLALAVFGASAQTLVSSGCGLNGISGNLISTGLNGGLNGGLINGLSGINSGFIGGATGFNGIGSSIASTPVLENVPLRLPSIVHPTSVQESCNCIKTVVRPQLRKEVFTIPSVQRFVQTTSTPVVETLPFVSGSSVDVPAVSGVETGLIGGGISGLNNGLVSGGLVSGGLVSGGLVSNGLVSNGLVSGGLVSGGFGSGLISGCNTGFGTGLTSGVVSGVTSGCGTTF